MRILIVGYLIGQQKNEWLIAPKSEVRVDLELRLIDFLREQGYEVWYKAHPDRLKETIEVFKGKVKIIGQPPFRDGGIIRDWWFRYIISKVDIVFFESIGTTAFPIALSTNKHVITLDLSFRKFEPLKESFEKLKKRIRIVPTVINDRIFFSKPDLMKALVSPPEREGIREWNRFIGKIKRIKFFRGAFKYQDKTFLVSGVNKDVWERIHQARRDGYRIVYFFHGRDLGLSPIQIYKTKPYEWADEGLTYTPQIALHHKEWVEKLGIKVRVEGSRLYFDRPC